MVDDVVNGSSDASEHRLLIGSATSATSPSPSIVIGTVHSFTALWSVAVVGV